MKCAYCGSASCRVGWHEYAREVGAINEVAINVVPINTEEKAHVTRAVSRPSPGAGEKVVSPVTPNGRKREAYNEYMRGYMAERRAKGQRAKGVT